MNNRIFCKSGVVYRYECDSLECDEKYTGESRRTFGELLKEHLRTPSPVYHNANTTIHHTRVDSFSVVDMVVHKNHQGGHVHQGQYPSLKGNISKFSSPIYGMRSCSIPLTSISNSPFHNSSCPVCLAHTPHWAGV